MMSSEASQRAPMTGHKLGLRRAWNAVGRNNCECSPFNESAVVVRKVAGPSDLIHYAR